jgi:hypothetical protein
MCRLSDEGHHCPDYSIAALEDQLVEVLSFKEIADVTEEEDADGCRTKIYFHRMYLEQAEALLHKINLYEPPPEFAIFSEDIPQGLARELEKLDRVMMKKVITDAVRRLYESVDPDYFHTNGVYGKVRWRISKENGR